MNPCPFVGRFVAGLAALTLIGAGAGGAHDLTPVKENLAEGEPVKIICFGDSVTGLYYHTGGRRTYTDMLGIALKKVFPQASVTMRNAGISGNTTIAGLKRVERDVLAHRPDLVTVMFGLNDMVRTPLKQYGENLGEIVDRCRGVGAKVILCTPNAVTDTERRPTAKLIDYCSAMREVARRKNVALCDTYHAFDTLRKRDRLKWRLMMSDAIHPNMGGHQQIAKELTRTISGKVASLADVGPPVPTIPRVRSLMKEAKAIRVLAMTPYDRLLPAALKQQGKARLEVTPWPTSGRSLRELEAEAKQWVRKMKPDLVIVAAPRDAAFASQEEFIHAQAWIMNWSLSFGRQEWDCVAVHPSVAEPKSGEGSHDDLIRKLVAAQDLWLIDRPPGNRGTPSEILGRWFAEQLAQEY